MYVLNIQLGLRSGDYDETKMGTTRNYDFRSKNFLLHATHGGRERHHLLNTNSCLDVALANEGHAPWQEFSTIPKKKFLPSAFYYLRKLSTQKILALCS